MNDESAKKVILARRARFVAAAMMGVGLASCEGNCAPSACLKVAVPEPDAAPMPCLSPPALPPDAGATVSGGDAGDDAAVDAGPADAGPVARPRPVPPPPRVCLSVRPSPCLKMGPGSSEGL
jgi:hypothetical protein